jgi:hypothetical protein
MIVNFRLPTNINLVVVAAKSTSDARSVVVFPPDPNSPQSTISTVEREIREAGGSATAITVDVRDFESVQRCVDKTIEVTYMSSPLSEDTGLTQVWGCRSTVDLMCWFTTRAPFGGLQWRTPL